MSLKVGDVVNHEFLVVGISEATTKQGKMYLSLDIKNRWIETNTKIWDWEQLKPFIGPITVGGYLFIEGVVESFNGQIQIKTTEFNVLDPAIVNMSEIVEVPNKSLDELKTELWKYIGMIQHPNLRELCESALDQSKGLWSHFITRPAASKNHHATRHGLLEHTVSMMGLAVEIQSYYHFLSLDLLLAGCLWHDLGKVYEINDVLDGGYSIEGKLLGHINLGISLIDQILASERYEVIDDEEIDLLKHMILSHHGTPEWGSPIKPSIPEADALHMIDMMDSTFYKLFKHMKDVPVGEFISYPLPNQYYKHELSEIDKKDYYRK